MPKTRGYVDTRLMQEAIKKWPDLGLLSSTSAQIEFVFKKALQLFVRRTKINEE